MDWTALDMNEGKSRLSLVNPVIDWSLNRMTLEIGNVSNTLDAESHKNSESHMVSSMLTAKQLYRLARKMRGTYHVVVRDEGLDKERLVRSDLTIIVMRLDTETRDKGKNRHDLLVRSEVPESSIKMNSLRTHNNYCSLCRYCFSCIIYEKQYLQRGK